MKQKITKTKLVRKINVLASSPFELIVIDSSTGVAYQRNTDFEWVGGNLYNSIGKLPEEALNSQKVFHPNVRIRENFGREVANERFVPVIQFYNNYYGR